jgi:hypothetical protein
MLQVVLGYKESDSAPVDHPAASRVWFQNVVQKICFSVSTVLSILLLELTQKSLDIHQILRKSFRIEF